VEKEKADLNRSEKNARAELSKAQAQILKDKGVHEKEVKPSTLNPESCIFLRIRGRARERGETQYPKPWILYILLDD
jgi:hypothetical protein